jgi:predicted metal-dependent hydrolase
MKRKHIEELILAISPDTDVHLFNKRELRFVLVHEVAHLKVRAERADALPAYPTR